MMLLSERSVIAWTFIVLFQFDFESVLKFELMCFICFISFLVIFNAYMFFRFYYPNVTFVFYCEHFNLWLTFISQINIYLIGLGT